MFSLQWGKFGIQKILYGSDVRIESARQIYDVTGAIAAFQNSYQEFVAFPALSDAGKRLILETNGREFLRRLKLQK